MPTIPSKTIPKARPVLADLEYRGDGILSVRPSLRPADTDAWLSPKEAAKRLHLPLAMVYTRLCDESIPLVVWRRVARKKILLSKNSLEAYRRAASNPAFAREGVVRNTHIAGVRAALASLLSPGN